MEQNSIKKSGEYIDKMRWVTLILVFFVGATSAFLNCLSVYLTPLAEKGWNPAVIVTAYTLMMFMSVPGSLIGGKIQAKFGNKTVLKVCGLGFLISVVAASFSVNPWMYVILIGGFAPLFVYCIYVGQIANLGALFPDKTGFATGALMVGIYVIGAGLVPVAARMTAAMDVMHGIAILGVIIGGLTILVGFLMVEAPEGYKPSGWEPKEYEIIGEGEPNQSTGSLEVTWQKLLKLKSFWVLFLGQIAMALFVSGIQSSFVMMTANLLRCTEAKAAWAYSVFAVLMGCSGIVAGFISDKILGPVKITAITAIVAAIALVVFVLIGSDSFTLYMLLVVIIGFAVGTGTTLLAVILMNMYGNKYFGINFGLIQCAMLLSAFVGPQLAVATNVRNFFVVGAVGLVVGAVLFLLVCPIRNKEVGMKLL